MRPVSRALVVSLICATVGGCNGKSSSTSSDGGGDGGGGKDESTAGESLAGTGTIAIAILPKDGAAPESVAGASVAVLDHPEITAVASDTGVAQVNNVPPGTVSLIITSADGAALTTATASYGLKLDGIEIKPNEESNLGEQMLEETGSISGFVKFYTNPNNLDLTGSEVFIPGTSFFGTTDANGAFTIAGIPAGTYKLRAQHTGFSVLDLAEISVIEADDSDLGDLLLSLSNGPEGGIAIASDALVTLGNKNWEVVTDASRSVTVHLTYDGDTALMKLSDEPSFLNKEWVPVASEVTWNLFDSDGQKAIYVMYSDLNGLESSPYKVEFIIDSEAPSDGSIAIQNGWDQIATTTTYMRATLSAADQGTGIEWMKVCPTNNFDTCGDWIPYSTEFAYLPTGPHAHARFKDYVGHVSETATDVINVGSHTIIAGGTYEGDLRLFEEQSPYRYDSQIDVKGNMTIDPGVTLDDNGANIIKVRGRLKAEGTSGSAITISSVAGTFGGFDLTNSTANDNSLQFISVGSGDLMTNPFVKINGGTVSHNTIAGDTGATFLQKTGYKTLLIEGNSVSDAKIDISGGSATTIRGNTIASNNNCPMIQLLAGDDTVIEYNTIEISCSDTGTDISGIEVAAGDVDVSYNHVEVRNTLAGLSTAVTIGGGGTLTASHNNFDIQSTPNAANVRHLIANNASIALSANHYTLTKNNAHTGTGAITSSGDDVGLWPITSGATGCVGAACP